MSKARALALAFFAVFAFSAFAAGSAQAGWLILGSLLIGSEKIVLLTITHKNSRLKYTSGAESVTIECPVLDIQGGEIHEADTVLVESLLFLKCKTVEPTACSLPNETINEATIHTAPLEALVTLDGPLAVKAKVKPKTGSVFATFKFEGASCALTTKQAVSGTAEILSPEGRDERLWHLISVLIETPGELKLGSANAEIEGSALVRLESDMLWSFD